ncbi:MAG TPA: MFS transporter [Thermoflexia bacterium]|nr:MFS transporter [Thermoflexia bacterium]
MKTKFRALLHPRWRGAIFFFFFWAMVASFGPFKNVYYQQLGLSGFQIGILAAIPAPTILFVAPYISLLADRYRCRRTILVWVLGLSAVLTVLLGIPQTFPALLPLSILLALTTSPFGALSTGLISHMATRHHTDFGNQRLWGSFSYALVAIICGAIWGGWGYRWMFIVGGVLALPVIGIAWTLEEIPPAEITEQATPSLRRICQDQGLLVLLVATFLSGIAESLYINFSGVYMAGLAGGQLLVGAVGGLGALVEMPLMHYNDAIARKIGPVRLIIWGYLIEAIVLGAYALWQQPWLLLFFATLKGAGFGLYYVATVRLVDLRAPASWSATLQSLVTAAWWGLAPLMAMPLGGWMADRWGLQSLFAVGGIAALLGILLLGIADLSGKFDETPLLKS